MSEIIGKLEHGYYYAGYTDNGRVYKNPEKLVQYSIQVCYIPEAEFEDWVRIKANKVKGYSWHDLADLVKAYLAENPHLDNSEDAVHALVLQLFGKLDWQYPETLIAEWDY